MSEITKNELAETLLDMVTQSCHQNEHGAYESGFISAYADAIRMLSNLGLMEITHDGYGRCVHAKLSSRGE